VDSEVSESGNTIIYKYEVVPGINMMSSVQELLLESKVLELKEGQLDAFSLPLKTSEGDIEDE
jgi:hypothetical protein